MPNLKNGRRYQIRNWAHYNRALVQRGSLTVWVESETAQGWFAKQRGNQLGRPQIYSDDAVLMLLVLREVYHLPLRAVQGLAESIFQLMNLDIPVPSYTQICRRAKSLGRVLKRSKKRGKIDVVFDSTGLKVYGEGEWKVRSHGTGKRRTWKKFHVGIDPNSQEILVCRLTNRDGGDASTAIDMLTSIEGSIGQVLGDGAYDGSGLREVVYQKGGDLIVPPPKNATYKGAEDGWQRQRDADLAEIQGLGGDDDARALWKKLVGYHRRSLVETTMYRLKQILGNNLKSRCGKNQSTEVQCKSLVLNKMRSLGMPVGEWIDVIT